jgi:hypothetical protein
LERPTLTKGSLTKRRFEKGGEVKKSEGESLQSPEEQPVVEESSASRALKQLVAPVREGIKGYFGMEPETSGSEAYRTGQALSNMPGVGAPAGAVKAGAIGMAGLGQAFRSLARSAKDKIEFNKALKEYRELTGALPPRDPDLLDKARQLEAFKGEGLSVPPETFSAKELMDQLREQGVDVERTWLRGKRDPGVVGLPQREFEKLLMRYELEGLPDAAEKALRDSQRVYSGVGAPGTSLSRQLEDRDLTKFNTKGGVWLTDSPGIADTYAGDKGFVIPVLAPRPDVVLNARGESWADYYKKNKEWLEAFADPSMRLIEVRNIMDPGVGASKIPIEKLSEEELRSLLTSNNLFAKKPFDQRVVSKLTGEPFPYKKGGPVDTSTAKGQLAKLKAA